MPRLNEKVLAMVRQELETDSTITNKALLDRAKKISRAVGRLSPRQFHALYRLRVTRELAAERPAARRRGTRKKARSAPRKSARKTKPSAAKAPESASAREVDRRAIRAVLLDLALKVAAADKAAAIHLAESLDHYVDRVVAAVE